MGSAALTLMRIHEPYQTELISSSISLSVHKYIDVHNKCVSLPLIVKTGMFRYQQSVVKSKFEYGLKTLFIPAIEHELFADRSAV